MAAGTSSRDPHARYVPRPADRPTPCLVVARLHCSLLVNRSPLRQIVPLSVYTSRDQGGAASATRAQPVKRLVKNKQRWEASDRTGCVAQICGKQLGMDICRLLAYDVKPKIR